MTATQSETTKPGYVNRNGQVVIRDTGIPGTDHLQTTYQLACSHCGYVYGSNGAGNFERKCPNPQCPKQQKGVQGDPLPKFCDCP